MLLDFFAWLILYRIFCKIFIVFFLFSGTNLGAASVDLETGRASWFLRCKSDVFAQQIVNSVSYSNFNVGGKSIKLSLINCCLVHFTSYYPFSFNQINHYIVEKLTFLSCLDENVILDIIEDMNMSSKFS